MFQCLSQSAAILWEIFASKHPQKTVVLKSNSDESPDICGSTKNLNMTSEEFLHELQAHAESFAKAVATDEGEWIIKGFIDVYRRIYTISVDTKIGPARKNGDR